MSHNPYQKYKSTSVLSAPREQVLLMLYEGAIKFNKLAIQAAEQKKIADRGQNILRAFDIILELQVSLDHNVGGDLAKQLDVDPQLLRAVRQPAHLDLPHETRLSGVDFSDRFAAVTTPILVLRGMDSEIVNDSVVKRMFEIHPLTRIHECPDSGHPVAYSKTVCEAIRHFIGL